MRSRRRFFDFLVRMSWASLRLLWTVIRTFFHVFAANYRNTENWNFGEESLDYGVLAGRGASHLVRSPLRTHRAQFRQ